MTSKRLFPLAIAALLIAACGGSSTDAGSQPTEEGLKASVRISTEAALSSKFKVAYAYLSEDCRSRVSLGDFAGLLMMGTAFLSGMSDIDPKDLRVGEIEVTKLSDTSGTIRAELRTGDGTVFTSLEDSDPIEWVYEEGGWKTTDCEDFESDGDLGFGTESAPDCSELVDGEPVSDSFRSEDTGEIDLTCLNGDTLQLAIGMPCWFGDRSYSSFDDGYAFQDEGIFHSGEVRGCLPPCSELKSGSPVPSEFVDDSTAGFSLNCETTTGDTEYSFEWECFDSERMYVTSDRGYAFVDDRIFETGDAPTC
jgi:hypothetical protein